MPEPSRRRRYLVLAICCMSLLIVGLDNTIVNVALPSIRRELNASVSGLQWTVDAYTLVLAALLMPGLFVPESRAARARRIDPVGQVLVMVILGSLTYAIIEGPGSGWTSGKIIFFFALSAVALAALLLYEPRRDEPLLDLRFFSSAPFSGAAVI